MKKQIFLLFFLSSIGNVLPGQTPHGTALLSKDIHVFRPFGFDKKSDVVEEVPVAGQAFIKALRVNTTNQQSTNRELGITLPLTTSVKNGDVLWLTFQSRCIKSSRESGEALLEVRLEELVDGKFEWPAFMERGFSVGKDWVQTSIPIEIRKLPFHSKSFGDVLEPNNVRLVFRFDKYPQILEIGPVTLLNCGKVFVNDLPRSTVSYDGDKPGAAWRSTAQERIEKIRKGDLTVVVEDQNGNKVAGAQVSVRMLRSAFNWGTAINSSFISGDNADAKIYRDTLQRYFNQVVFENELKWKYWFNKDDHFESALKTVDWLNEKKISVRGHVMVWPSWKHSPKGLDALKNDTVALQKAIVESIRRSTKYFKGKLSQWDVVNEPTMHHEIIDVLGQQAMLNWFNEARKGAPGTKLFLNDFTMFHGQKDNGEGLNSDYFYNTAKYLVEKGAPIDAIGEQAHIGGTPPGIPLVLSRLDKFSALKKPIQITEFDIYSDDDDFKARYIGDFMTALFSHPSAIGFVQWGFWEKAHWLPMGALWDKNWNLRPHGKVYTDLVTKTWSTNVRGTTGKNGLYNVRVFNGEYDITVTHYGKTLQQQCTVDSRGKLITVKL